ncbi:MAG TPA: TIGR02594 family protein [Fulvivirga sp.]|nr:TIGR02594 family protein [Fulvivirga sp.]
MSSILQIAMGELGQREIVGEIDNPRIVNYAVESGIAGVSNDDIAWCSNFVNWVAFKADLKRTNKANARSWLLVGQKVDEAPEPGDVVIFWREKPESWKGHVGFFLGFSKNGSRVYCLGGNQGNSVSISAYPAETILGFRRLQQLSIIKLPNPILKLKDKGESVIQLQDALNAAGFNCGTSDGYFGDRTMTAVKLLQSQSGHLAIDGVYGKKTKDYLFSVLNA